MIGFSEDGELIVFEGILEDRVTQEEPGVLDEFIQVARRDPIGLEEFTDIALFGPLQYRDLRFASHLVEDDIPDIGRLPHLGLHRKLADESALQSRFLLISRGIAQGEMLPRPGDRHEEEPPLLFIGFRFRKRFGKIRADDSERKLQQIRHSPASPVPMEQSGDDDCIVFKSLGLMGGKDIDSRNTASDDIPRHLDLIFPVVPDLLEKLVQIHIGIRLGPILCGFEQGIHILQTLEVMILVDEIQESGFFDDKFEILVESERLLLLALSDESDEILDSIQTPGQSPLVIRYRSVIILSIRSYFPGRPIILRDGLLPLFFMIIDCDV